MIPMDKLSSYVKEHGGDIAISKILMASNGLAAVKGMRSIRNWVYETFGDESLINFVAMATKDDLEANAEFVKLADELIEVSGGPNNFNYANVDLIVSLAKKHNVHAVWSGWGHASENPRLPDLLAQLDPPIMFIGPSGRSMRALGDKISSIIVAQTANVETVPWSGSGLVVSSKNNGCAEVDPVTYMKACCSNVEEGLKVAQNIGLPVMIKASEGGGGKGIRRVDTMDQFGKLFKLVQSEVPGSPVFVMKVAENARHLEVQLVCDKYGNATTLFGRDCSVQRRHQKILEEAPVTVCPPEVMRELEEAAIRLAKLVKYENVGTVEYLYDIATQKYCFLELNPRLQVEHPTTEMVSGVNIPACQLLIAMGIPLHRISSIRKLYKRNVDEIDEFSLDLNGRSAPNGHVIAARLTAENPAEGFKPNGGLLHHLQLRTQHKTWGYFSVGAQAKIHDYSDSQFGHVFAHCNDRSEACKSIVETLKNSEIHAEFRTNLDYVAALIEHEKFTQNNFSTAWLDGLIQSNFCPPLKDVASVIVCTAAILADKTFQARKNAIMDSLKKRHYPSKDLFNLTALSKFIYRHKSYEFQAWLSSDDTVNLKANGQSVSAKISRSSRNVLLISFCEMNHVVQVQDNGHCLNLIIDGRDCLIEFENDPSSIRAPSSGRIVKFLVDEGGRVEVDQSICEIEVMKMYLPISSQGSGFINFKRPIGASIQAGDLIASIELDGQQVDREIERYSGNIISRKLIESKEDIHETFQRSENMFNYLMTGYHIGENVENIIQDFLQSSSDERLPYLKFDSILASLRNKLPADLVSELDNCSKQGQKNGEMQHLLKIENLLSSFDEKALALPLLEAIHPHMNGAFRFVLDKLTNTVNSFMECEKFFDSELTVDGPLNKLFMMFGDSLEKVSSYVEMHAQLEHRISAITCLLDVFLKSYPEASKLAEFSNSLRLLASLEGREYGRLTLKAREIMLAAQIPSLDELFHRMEAKFSAALGVVEDVARRADFIDEMVQGFATHLDVLPRFFHHSNPHIRRMALEIYTKRVFAAYLITASGFSNGEGHVFEWVFSTHPKEDLTETFGHRRRPSSATVYPIVGINGASEEVVSKVDGQRKGYMAAVEELTDLKRTLTSVLQRISANPNEDPNHLYLIAKAHSEWSDEEHGNFIQGIIKSVSADLSLHRVRRITLALVREKIVAVGFYTFSESNSYNEDLTLRNIEPAMAYLLEAPRLLNYEIEGCYTDASGQVRIYLGTERRVEKHQRLFIRLIVRPNTAMKGFESMVHFAPQAYHILEEVIQAVEAVQAKKSQTFDQNHLFINIVPVFYNQPGDVLNVLQQLVEAYKSRWAERRIKQVEVRMSLAPSKESSSCRYRFFLDNDNGYVARVHGYQEHKDPRSGFKFLSSLDGRGRLDGYPVTFYYPHLSVLQSKRNKIIGLETPYVHDFTQIFEYAVEQSWKKYQSQGGDVPTPSKLLDATELILGPNGSLVPTTRGPGLNIIGMVAWRIRLFTPEAPTGRDVVVIANDIGFQAGSFGPEEDILFDAASKLARAEGIPRIFLSANSGARLGVAEEIRNALRVAWINPDAPELGFEYLYLEPADFEALKTGTVVTERITTANDEMRHKIVDIIGAKHGLGIENLQGSALIAGETARAYDDIFTISLVSGRSVGIGAYLLRLGHRVIQKHQHPIILTGVNALNSLLGREVYQSNLQLGGPQIMYANGLAHRVVLDDLDGATEVLNWLAFVPLSRGALPPVLRTRDNPLRQITFQPTSGLPYDPRHLIEGCQSSNGWLSGLVDRGSFIESMAGWAKSVVTGRARLGGYPIGVIAVETRTTEVVIPADPANPNSTANCITHAGQVWFPDSANKTAQAIRDFSKGECLPIFILANWRGFSGGQRDLYDQILQFGSQIVDALKDVKQPVFVYLPPEAELRGGAWVVLDSQINSDYIEMYADPSARGGILEPEGVVGIKFRSQHLHSLMSRIDPSCQELNEQLEAAPTPQAREDISKRISARRTKLLPVYRQVACAFADAHDTPGRMKAKGAIREIVPWKQARAYFYHRLRRLNAQAELLATIKGHRLTFVEKRTRLANLLLDRFSININDASDEAVFDQISEHMPAIKENIRTLNVNLAKAEIARIVSELSSDISIDGLSLN